MIKLEVKKYPREPILARATSLRGIKQHTLVLMNLTISTMKKTIAQFIWSKKIVTHMSLIIISAKITVIHFMIAKIIFTQMSLTRPHSIILKEIIAID